MTKFMTYTRDCSIFSFPFLSFRSQTDVVYDTTEVIRLTKSDLIACINYVLTRLTQIGYIDKINHGFVLDKYKYYELSTYLHGLLVVYSGLIDVCPPTKLSVKRFSQLPHEVLKSDKETLVIEVAAVNDPEGPLCYCCVIGYIPICSRSIEGLRKSLLARFPHWKSKYNILLNVK